MNIDRKWVTPLIVGSFLLSGATGILIFFHFDLAAAKLIHEWFSWVLVSAVAFHVIVNFQTMIKSILTRQGLFIVSLFIAFFALSFIPIVKKEKPPFIAPIQALSQVPLTTLSQVAQVPPEELIERLSRLGIKPTSEQQKLSDLVGNDFRKQIQILNTLLNEIK